MENLDISNVMLDAQNMAAGCISITDVMGSVLGPGNFYLGFTKDGLLINGGHEVQVINSWFGQYLYDDSRKETGHAHGITVLGT